MTPSTLRRITVLGSGNGGLAAAADLSLRGYDVTLVSRSATRLEALGPTGAIHLEGVLGTGTTHIRATTDLTSAVARADLVMLTVPGTELAAYGPLLAPAVRDRQPILLNPGGVGGSLQLADQLRRHGCRVRPLLGELGTLAYTARTTAPGTVRITNAVPNLPFAALPAAAGAQLHELVVELYPTAILLDSVLETAFASSNVVAHPPQVLLNAARIESTNGEFYFYRDGTTPAVGRLMDALDSERLSVAASLGVAAPSYPEIVLRNGYTTAEAAATGSAYACARAGQASRHIRAPRTLDHRFLHEDIGFGLVPLAAWASLSGTPTPVMDALIAVGSAVSGRPYAQDGRTLEQMGLDGYDVDALLRRVGANGR